MVYRRKSCFIGETGAFIGEKQILSAKFHFYRRTANISNKSFASLPTNQSHSQKAGPHAGLLNYLLIYFIAVKNRVFHDRIIYVANRIKCAAASVRN